MSERDFSAKPAVRGEEPLLLGMVGPPGGGKTRSALRLARGIQEVRGGPIVLIDTEAGRSRKHLDAVKFDIVEMGPPCRSDAFLEAIRQQLPRNPAAIIVDSLSDEHEGEGGYLEWHDEMVPKMGGNEWAAWAKPKAARKKLINGILRIKTPLIFTFRAREKTKQMPKQSGRGTEVVNIGWQPVAPLEIVHTLDLTCILPPRADGVPVWHSEKIGEEFIIKLPDYLAPFIKEGAQIDEAMGRAFATWAKGGDTKSAAATQHPPAADVGGEGSIPPGTDLAPNAPDVEAYESYVDDKLMEEGITARALAEWWNSAAQKKQREGMPLVVYHRVKAKVVARIEELKEPA